MLSRGSKPKIYKLLGSLLHWRLTNRVVRGRDSAWASQDLSRWLPRFPEPRSSAGGARWPGQGLVNPGRSPWPHWGGLDLGALQVPLCRLLPSRVPGPCAGGLHATWSPAPCSAVVLCTLGHHGPLHSEVPWSTSARCRLCWAFGRRGAGVESGGLSASWGLLISGCPADGSWCKVPTPEPGG